MWIFKWKLSGCTFTWCYYFSLLHENNLLLFSFWFETLYEIEWMTQKQVRGWYLWLNFVGWLVGGNVQLLWVYIKISSSCKKEKPMDNRRMDEQMDLKKFASGKYVANYKNWGVNLLQSWQMPHLPIFRLPLVWYANLAFTIFVPYLLVAFTFFATYLQGANLCKSIFRPVRTSVLFVLQTGFFIR